MGSLPRRDLPIFFSSTGGLVGQAVSLGEAMREYRMTAGVGRTMPEGCRGGVDDACRRMIQSKREHKARRAAGNERAQRARGSVEPPGGSMRGSWLPASFLRCGGSRGPQMSVAEATIC